jgi:D-serine deaminase-like pyridoxal phosphate-dependent protein
MVTRAPAEVGCRLSEVDTPALLLDLSAFERNLRRMAEHLRGTGIHLRPHAKTHKSARIAALQVANGAIGVSCQKVSEAECMVRGGMRDILITNQIVGAQKLSRLCALALQARITVCVDDAHNVRDLGLAAAACAATLGVLVEIDVGANRCGVPPDAAALDLARTVAATPGLRFEGLQAYHGPAQHTREYGARKAQIEAVVSRVRQLRDLIQDSGMACPVISGGGTGAFALEAASGVYTELQAGSYIFMDADYARNELPPPELRLEFEHSLFVRTTIMSRPAAGRAVVDAGLKAIGVDAGMPLVHEVPGAHYIRASDEHGVLRLDEAAQSLRLGDCLQLVAGNCDPTVNLHDWYVALRDQRVEALWPVDARGPGY